ncbi:MAG: hypothetical protein NWE89_08680 [Candidatus Bathyarchaeota archaeon]|nr:hypothetical protein [Candidatus Bathyarchaeota archaeon]
MPILTVLCIDGLDFTFSKTLGLGLPYEVELSIPRELYYNGSPHTMHIWPSMFTGQIHVYSKFRDKSEWRLKAREVLHKLGIRWRRDKTTFTKKPESEKHAVSRIFCPPEITSSVFDEFNSFIHDIPGVSKGFVFGGNYDDYMHKKTVFDILAKSLERTMKYDLVALYSGIIDYLNHWGYDVDSFYRLFFAKAQMSKTPVIIVSDHGCVDGQHTETAYLGATFPVEAESVLDVADVIRGFMKEVDQ